MRALLMLSVTVLMMATGTEQSDAQARPCPPPSALDTLLRARTIEIITDSVLAEMRVSLGITTGDTSGVSIVTATAICEAITHRFDQGTTESPRATALIVVRFPGFFAATAPDRGRIDSIYLFDEQYQLKTAIGGT
jgi:hypothetical protein